MTLLLISVTWSPIRAEPLAPSFSYQGYLKHDGFPAEGIFDFQFQLFSAESGGIPVGTALTREGVTVEAGLFHTNLMFGADILTGDSLWLQVGVRGNGGGNSGAFTDLNPRQPLYAFSLNGKEPNFSTKLTGLVTKVSSSSTLIGNGTAFTHELQIGDSLLVDGEVFTVVDLLNDSQLEVVPLPQTSILDSTAFRDDALLRVRAGDGQNKLHVNRRGITVGPGGSTIGRIEHGTIGNCASAGSAGAGSTVVFQEPFKETPRVLLTPKVGVVGCTGLRLNKISATQFSWLGFHGNSFAVCDCVSWLAIGF